MAEDLITKIEKIVDIEFSEKILRDSECDPRIRVSNVLIKPATAKGDNYTSDMFRVTIEYTSDGNDAIAKKSFIVKVEPMAEGMHKELISKSSLFGTEIMMMTDTLTKMNEVLGPGKPALNGRGLYTQKANPPLLVIEDLAPLGYRMADRQAGLDMHHCLLAIRGLARFHASSVALCEKEPEQKQRYTRGMFNKCQPEEMHMFFIKGAKQLGEEVSSWPELDPKYSEKILKLADKIYQRGCEISVCNDDQFNVINHGDFWINNMLFKYDEEQRPVGHIFVDFQLCLYSSPAIDLQYFFNTSLTDSMLMENEETLLEEYIRTLSETMSEAGCQTEPPTIDQLKTMLRERALFGMIASFTILPVLLVNKDEVKDLSEIMNSEDGANYNNPAYKGKLFRAAMARRIPKFDELGLFD